MSKALMVISTDWHIKSDNIDQLINLVSQKIELAKSMKCNTLICLGDIFHSRQAQPLSVLKCFESILDMIDEAGMILTAIPGNHDRVDYDSCDSFLDPFRHHPVLELKRTYESLIISEDIKLWFLPYFNESVWLSIFKSNIWQRVVLEDEYKHILCSHQAMYGSTNNDGTKVNNAIMPDLFKMFFKVFLGHYHQKQQIGKNIFHLPSIQANNFGEDNEKGFTVLYDDGSHELVNSKFNQYHTLKLNLDELSKEEINDIKKDAGVLIKESGANVRFKIEGSEDKVAALKQEKFTAVGIDIKKEHKFVVKSIEKAETGEVVVYNDETILTKFNTFCDKEEYDDKEYGKDCLAKKLKENRNG